jgi:hypothetical protein
MLGKDMDRRKEFGESGILRERIMDMDILACNVLRSESAVQAA